MLQNWEQASIGNNPGTVSALAPRGVVGRVLIRAFTGRRHRRRLPEVLPSAA